MVSLKERLEKIEELPALPSTLGQLLNLLNDDRSGSEDVEKVIIIDRAIGMAVMRAANSARFGGAEEIGSLKDAITRLGSKQLLHVALAQQSSTFFESAGKGYGLEGTAAWEGALAGALAADMIARDSGLCDPGTAFTAALLRDCGKLAMDLLIGVEELRRVFCSPRGTTGQLDLERSSFGFDHAEVGAELARTWGLPQPLIEAIRYHHAPPADLEDRLADTVYCAELVSMQMGYGVGFDGLAYEIDKGALERAKVDHLSMMGYIAEVTVSMAQMAQDAADESPGRGTA
jgi:HD-like signal output (HDOD) protein